MIDWLQEVAGSNQFLSGGAVLMVMGAVLASLRTVPGYVYGWAKRKLIIELDIPDTDECFKWISVWLAEHSYCKQKARLLTVSSRKRKSRRQAQPAIELTPAPGTHWFFYKGRLVILERTRDKSAGAELTLRYQETYTLRLFSRNREIARHLVEEARDLAVPKSERRVAIMKAAYGRWDSCARKRPRPLESVIWRRDTLESLHGDMERFLGREKWYVDRGIPYRRGYLLYGKPGNGKSSAVFALASSLGLDICILSLSKPNFSDDDLHTLMSSLPKNAILLIEDIDCIFNQRDTEYKVTFSGLLNAIDGVAASEGRVLIMTTNHVEKLDAALIRPGRIDMQVEIMDADRDQAVRMFHRFFPKATSAQRTAFGDAIPEDVISMATLQGLLLRCSDDADLAIKATGELRRDLAVKYAEIEDGGVRPQFSFIHQHGNGNGNGNKRLCTN